MLADNALHSANPGRKKENERTRLQTCHWLSKCQIRPSLSSLGRVSLRLLSFSHKKVAYPMRDRGCQADHRADALSTEKLGFKKFVTKRLWYFIMWAQPDTVQRAARFPEGYLPLTVVYGSICQGFPYVRGPLSYFLLFFGVPEWSKFRFKDMSTPFFPLDFFSFFKQRNQQSPTSDT